MDATPLARVSDASVRDWLVAEPFTLSLSAGFFGFFAHLGFMKALAQAQVQPRRIVGVSAGALVGGLCAAGLSLTVLEEELRRLSRDDFWDAGTPVGGILKGRKFAALLDTLLMPTGCTTIEACPVPFAPVVFDVWQRRSTPLEQGSLTAAIRASCALPGLFRPVRVNQRWYLDGGVRDRVGATAWRKSERVLVHHLKSTSPWQHLGRRWTQSGPMVDALELCLPNLARVTPFRLATGAGVVAHAHEQTTRWLGAPFHLVLTHATNAR